MKYLAVVFALLCAVDLATIHAQQPDYETLKAEAEKYARQSVSASRNSIQRARFTALSCRLK